MSQPHALGRTNQAGSAGSWDESWDLRLYVTGRSPKCLRAIENLRRVCEEHLAGRYQIEIVDVLKNPRRAAADQILAAPTVVRRLPASIRKLVGDLSDNDRLMIGLELRSAGSQPGGRA